MVRTTALAVSLLLAGITAAIAQEHPEHPKKPAAQPSVVQATVVGQNICLGCSLMKEKGAGAQCSKYGHRHALKVTSATAGGKSVAELKGAVLHYLDTDKSQALLKDHHDATVTINGKVYVAERVIEVTATDAGTKPEHPEHPKH